MTDREILIFLDDIRDPDRYISQIYGKSRPTDVLVVRDYDHFLKEVESNSINMDMITISFDHDLGTFDENELEISGWDCMKWLMQYCVDNKFKRLPIVYIHTMNVVAAPKMRDSWLKFRYDYYDHLIRS